MQPDSLKQVASAAATPSGIRDEVCGMRHAACNSTVSERERVEEGYERDRHNYLSTRRGSQLKFDYVRCNATSKRHDVTQAHTLTHTQPTTHTHTHMQSSKSVDNVRVCERNAPAAAAEAIFLHFMQTNQLNGETFVSSYVPRPLPAHS